MINAWIKLIKTSSTIILLILKINPLKDSIFKYSVYITELLLMAIFISLHK